MRHKLLGTVAGWVAGAGLALAQQPAAPTLLPAPEPRLLTAPHVGSLPVVQAEKLPQPKGEPAKGEPAKGDKPAEAPKTTGKEMVWVDEPLCGLQGRFYADAEYIFWWTKGSHLPVLITGGAPGDLITTGSIGDPGTMVLYGGRPVDDEARSGWRVTAGFWLDREREIGIEASGFYLDPHGSHFSTTSDSQTILARPFANSTTSATSGAPLSKGGIGETSYLVGLPPIYTGSALVNTSTTLWGMESNARYNLGGNSLYRVDLLAGFRYLEMKDGLDIANTSTPLPGGFVNFQGLARPDATSLNILDTFNTTNRYYGGQIGTHVELHRSRWYVDFRGKVALGVMHQTADIMGQTVLNTITGTPTTTSGGLLALPSNIGSHSRDEFGIVPEAGINIGFQITENLRVHVGYSVLYFRSDILRASNSIDHSVDPNQIPTFSTSPTTSTRPLFTFRDADFWAQGLNAGIEFSF